MSAMRVRLDRLEQTRGALEDAAGDLDRLGHGVPGGDLGGEPGGELGAAEPLVTAALAMATEAAARLGAEAGALAAAVGMFRDDMTYADAVTVTDLFAVAP